MSRFASGFKLTNHAVEQFAHRWLPDNAAWHAEQDLHELLGTAKCIGRTKAGDLIYASKLRPDIRMVVKDHNVCVTVLPPYSDEGSDTEEDMELQEMMIEHYQHDKEKNAQLIKVLEAELQLVENQREELKAVYKQEIAELGTKKNDLMNQLAWLRR